MIISNNEESNIKILEPNRDILQKINDNLCLIKFMLEIICLVLTFKYLGERNMILVFIMIFLVDLINKIYRKVKNNGKF